MDTIVTGVAFGDGTIQLGYLDMEDQSDEGSLEKTLVMKLNEKDTRLVAEIQEALVQMITDYMTRRRNPPEVIDRNGDNRFLND